MTDGHEGDGVPTEPARVHLGMPADVSRTGRLPRREEPEGLRRLGERCAEAGHGLRGVVAHQCPATAAGSVGELHRTGDAVPAATEAAPAALGVGHQRAQRLATRQEGARRESVDDLLFSCGDQGLLAERAERFGLRAGGQGRPVCIAPARRTTPGA
ncbi:hypothetical protein ACGF07_12215 [Kitasatospora sp. NPDC048194]|uniref:hypothetical protein n=1 Tax=Kitasatospora sp. NPDC048194 TaxID=3364045 RepID=UPI00371C5EFB